MNWVVWGACNGERINRKIAIKIIKNVTIKIKLKVVLIVFYSIFNSSLIWRFQMFSISKTFLFILGKEVVKILKQTKKNKVKNIFSRNIE